MQLNGTEEITTKRLKLRKFVLSDAEMMFINWASKKECFDFLPWSNSVSLKEVENRLKMWIESYNDRDYFQWGIVDKSADLLIGVINLHDVSLEHMSAETSFIIAPEYWSKGYATEALQAIINYGFEQIGLNRIYADYFEGNLSSKRVLEKNNMILEGVIREKYLKNNTFINSYQHSILKKNMEHKGTGSVFREVS